MGSIQPDEDAGRSASGFQIRSFKPSDQAAVIHLWQVCGLVVPQNDPHRDIARKARVNPEMFLVGLRSGELVASCMAGYEGHRGWINYLAVAPDLRRSGLATRLMDQATRLLRKAGCPKINLQVRSTNDEVITFYRTLGYEVDEVVSLGLRLEPDEA
jgi:ribosomal protein S18 acetylase RimI-like enzyme